MRRESSDGSDLGRTNPHALASVAAVFRGEHEFLPHGIVVAFGPAIISSGFQEHQLFSRLSGLLEGLVKPGPVGIQLIPPVLSDEKAAGRVDGKSFPVANSSGEPARRGKYLVRLVGVVTPDAAAILQFGAGICALYVGLAILGLAGIGRGPDVDVERSLLTDDERVHGMVAAERQAGNDGLRRTLRNKPARGQ